jgi:homoserine O-acetyltransferase/O-succinyltransferase
MDITFLLRRLAKSLTAAAHCTHRFLFAFFVFSAIAYAQQEHAGGEMQASTNSSPWTHDHGTTSALQSDALFKDYRFRDGETLPSLRIHYATLGMPHRNGSGQIDNAVLLIHWTGADGSTLLSRNYMEALFAPGRPLDAARYFLIFPDNVGHGKSSKPSDGLKAGFPKYGYRDMVDLQHRLVTETLGIEHLHAILGMSMGGMNAWQWAETFPDAMDGIMPVVSMPIPISGRNMLWRRIVIDAIRSDPQWNGGNYSSPPRGWLKAFPLMRMMLDSVPHLQVLLPDGAAADEFIADAQRQAVPVDANDILYSLSSSADYDPEPGLATIETKVYALNFSDDESIQLNCTFSKRSCQRCVTADFSSNRVRPSRLGI